MLQTTTTMHADRNNRSVASDESESPTHRPIKHKRNHQAFRLLLDAPASKQWPLHQLRIPSACRHAFGLLVSGAYPWPGKRLSNAPEHMATLASLSWRPHILFPAASAWKNPLVFGGEKGISLEKFKCPSLAAWPHALLSSSCAKQCSNRLVVGCRQI